MAVGVIDLAADDRAGIDDRGEDRAGRGQNIAEINGLPVAHRGIGLGDGAIIDQEQAVAPARPVGDANRGMTADKGAGAAIGDRAATIE